jgi:tetratricopeptide (TPR) repeat protein
VRDDRQPPTDRDERYTRRDEKVGAETQPAFQAPAIPDDIAAADLDKDVRSELLSLSRDAADKVARHLVAAGQVIDEDADLAMQHAIAARRLASRIAVVREAVGLAAYAAGDWPTAIAELRTYHRMTGRQTHLAELADCERALGRPERAIDLFRGADKETLDKAGSIELLIVAAGARGDLGQHDAAVAMLQIRELTADEDAEWAARLRYAYADALLAAQRRDESREWFARAAAADEEGITDAAERLLELDGVTLDDSDSDSENDGEDDDEDEDGQLDAEADDDHDDHGDDHDDHDDEDSDDDEDDEDDEAVALADDDVEGDDEVAVQTDDEGPEGDAEEEDDELLAKVDDDLDDGTGPAGGAGEDDLTGDEPVVGAAGLTTVSPVAGDGLVTDVDAGIDVPEIDPRIDSADENALAQAEEKALGDEFVAEPALPDEDLAVEGGVGDTRPRS